MGLFSNLRKSAAAPTGAYEKAKAVMAMPLMVAAADGQLDESELIQITNMCAFSPIFHAVGAEAGRKIAVECLETIKTRGAEALFTDVQGMLTPKMAETALCFAVRTALADGVLEESEKVMLMAMGQRLNIPEETFLKIFDVMVMMQRRAD